MSFLFEKASLQLDPSVLSEKLAWQKEKVALQAALHKAKDDLVKATARNENRPIADLSNSKVNPQLVSFHAQAPGEPLQFVTILSISNPL